MKLFLLITCCYVFFICTSVGQSIITVSTNPNMDTDYHDLQAALDAASAGDSVYIHGNGYYNGTFTISKRLHLIGPGYYLVENNEYNTDAGNAQVKRLQFTAGSDSSSIEGLNITECIHVGTESLHIRKNFFSYTGSSFGSIQFIENVDDCFIYNNMLTNRTGRVISASSVVDTVRALLTNNIIQGNVGMPSSVDVVDLSIVNNTFIESQSTIVIGDSYLANNIFIRQQIIIQTNVMAENNIFRGSLPTGVQAANNNIANVNMSDVFTNLNLSVGLFIDSDFTDLKPAPNPATINCSPDGCGATLGVNPPYRDSGIPEIPVLYELISDSQTDSLGQLNIQIRARSY